MMLTLPTDFLQESDIESQESPGTVVITSEDALAKSWAAELTDSPTSPGTESSGDGTQLAADSGGECNGCATGGVGGWWLLSGLVALGRRRRSILPTAPTESP